VSESNGRIPDLLKKYEAQLLTDWVLEQTSALADHSDLIKESELKTQGKEFLNLLRNAARSGNLADIQAPEWEPVRDMLATVRASVGKITRLLARLQADRQERSHALIDPGERLKDIVENTLHGRDAEVVLTGDIGDGGVAIDPESFDAVATHLLKNAIEASPDAARVRVDIRGEALSMIVDIRDEGPGMTPEFIRDELFRPFASTKGDGHGIGVYQARELLREAGGDLLVLSRIGSGTTMRLLLPMVRGAADASRAAA